MENIKKKIINFLYYFLIVMTFYLGILAIVATGGNSGEVESDGESGEEIDDYMDLIAAFMDMKHDEEFMAFEEDQEIIDRDFSSTGLYSNSAYISQYIENFENHLQIFLTESVEYVYQTAVKYNGIDKDEIFELFDYYQGIDGFFIKDFTSDHIGNYAPDLVGHTIDELLLFINDAYKLAKMDIEVI